MEKSLQAGFRSLGTDFPFLMGKFGPLFLYDYGSKFEDVVWIRKKEKKFQ